MPFIEQSAAQARWDLSLPYSSHSDEVRRFTVASYCCPSRRSVSDAVGEGLLSGTVTTWITLPCGCRLPMTTDSTRMMVGAVGDYGGNHGDLSPGSVGSPDDFYYGGNGTGVIISSQAKCNSGIPTDWVDKVKQANITDGLSNTFLVGEMHVPLGKLGKAPLDAFIFNGDSAFNSTRVGGPTVPIVQDLHDESNGLVSWGSWHPGVSHFAFADGSVRGISKNMDTESLGNLCNRHDGSVVNKHD